MCIPKSITKFRTSFMTEKKEEKLHNYFGQVRKKVVLM